jgi:hypothetical protein
MTARHIPTSETRAIVERACAAGMTQEQIGRLLDLTDRSLRTHYKAELAKGAEKTHAAIISRLYELAMGPDARVAYNACALWLKARCHWREADAQTIAMMAKTEIRQSPVLTVPQISLDEWAEMARQHAESVHRLNEKITPPQQPQSPLIDLNVVEWRGPSSGPRPSASTAVRAVAPVPRGR